MPQLAGPGIAEIGQGNSEGGSNQQLAHPHLSNQAPIKGHERGSHQGNDGAVKRKLAPGHAQVIAYGLYKRAVYPSI